MNIAILGSGSWGLAISTLLHKNGHHLKMWSFSESEAEMLARERENRRLLPGIVIPEEMEISTSYDVVLGADMVVIATPSYAVYETAVHIAPLLTDRQIIVLLSKGFDIQNNNCLLTDMLTRVLESHSPIVVLTGPSHAEEVGRGMPTAVVAASKSKLSAELVQNAFMNSYFRVYTTPDVIGAQLGGAMKNIIALATGIAEGAGYGDNTRALLMTRGIAEMARMGVYMGGLNETFSGLSGVGDLIVTCISGHSRNHRAGLLIGGGMPVAEALKEVGAVVEGYYATQAVHELTFEPELDLPISKAMYRLLFEEEDLQEVIQGLINRDPRQEIAESWMSHIQWK